MMKTHDSDENSTSRESDSLSNLDERFDDLIDIYRKTQPREKVNRKLRDKLKNKKQKQRISSKAKILSTNKFVKKMQICNHKTRIDTKIITSNNFNDRDEEKRKKIIKNATSKDEKRQCKRFLKLNRLNKRDLELDIEVANQSVQHDDDKQTPTSSSTNSKKVFFGLTGLRVIQGKNRFLSLRSKRVEIDQSNLSKEFNNNNDDHQETVIPNDRELFHQTFSQLINLGNNDNDKEYQKDVVKIRWQNEIKDLIWLELKAYHADRNLVEQDEYLYRQRQTIGPLLNEIMEYKYDPVLSLNLSSRDMSLSNDSGYNDKSTLCTGCLSMYCYHCGKSQVIALKQIENLFLRLEEAEALYPNSHAFSLDYELYKSQEFCDKIKAICLWYNITKYHRLKLHILGRLFTNIDSKTNEQYYNELSFKEFDRQIYRKYIEEVLKIQGLTKSLNFLDRLYNTILQKTNITLKKLDNYDDNNYNDNWESKRYGVCSNEAKKLNLPSYLSSFIFLSRLPLDVVHEYIRLRLEQKLLILEPLTAREFMKELKEGINIACIHRDKFIDNSKIVLSLDESFHESLDTIPYDFQDIGEFNNNLKLIFQVYLNYFDYWINIVINNNNICYKTINNEWLFIKNITNKIKNGYNICGIKLCKIINNIINEINNYLINCYDKINNINFINDNTTLTLNDIRFKYLKNSRECQCIFIDINNKFERIFNLIKSIINEINKWKNKSFELNNLIDNLKIILLKPKYQMINLIQNFTLKINQSNIFNKNNYQDFNIIKIKIRQIFHQAFRMGFNYYKYIYDLFLLNNDNEQNNISYDLINFSKLWMNFVLNKCDKGRGIRPRWAYDGFKFLTIVCHPTNTKNLNNDDFENFKKSMDDCITHIIGENNNNNNNNNIESPVQTMIKSCNNFKSPDAIINNNNNNKRLNSSLIDDDSSIIQHNLIKHKKMMLSLNKIDNKIDENKKKYGLIGKAMIDKVDKNNINDIKFKIKKITFTWHRGICIGQGAFGKVYTVVNNKTGKLLAMKEIQLKYGNINSVNNVINELQIFQGIKHNNLICYYGMEINRDELLIFMELCTEGTLENFIKSYGTGLLDVVIRKYTHQLVLGVSVLHKYGIVHRDIKTANIFLTNHNNCLKIGDFGSAVKINNTQFTMTGEINGCVGTEAYMAPEVFMNNNCGRASDIWSIGCCVIEMTSGKRPWSEYNTHGQIMFKVGMGANPKIPDNISNDQHDFLNKCLLRNSKDRPTANDLLSHIFIRNFGDINIQ